MARTKRLAVPQTGSHKVKIVKLKGGHHFDGDYAALAQTIMTSARPRIPQAEALRTGCVLLQSPVVSADSDLAH